MAPPIAIRVLDRCRVAPPPDSAPYSASLPLTFFDIPWLLFPPSQPLFFFRLTISTSHFTSVTLPKLKHSLSLTLLEYFPFSGRLIQSPESETPAILYAEGDSVAMTVAEADGDFDHLCGHGSKDSGEFHQLVPTLLESNESSMITVQITVFSNAGVSVGLAIHHAIGDGRTFTNFMKTWSSIHRNGEMPLPKSFPLPFYDRSVIKERNALKEMLLQQLRKRNKILKETSGEDREDDSVRATFLMSPKEMERVKRWITGRCKRKGKPPPPLLSAYVLTCAFVWVCLSEARATATAAPPDPCFFGFIAGGITRLDYAVPTAYLGNCVAFGRAAAARKELMGEDGIVAAAEAIGRKIKELDGEVLGGAERWIPEWEVLMGGGGGHVVIIGSPKMDLYDVDFGWGRAMKIEEVSIDEMKSGISLTESRDIKAGIEIGLVLPKNQMDVFDSLYHGALNVLP